MGKETQPAITAGTKLVVVKGCKALNVVKWEKAEVVRIECLGAEYSHSVKIIVKIKRKNHVLYVKHFNRLSDLIIRMHNINPRNIICFGQYS